MLVDRHFDAMAEHWRDLYGDATLEGVIHRDRRSIALAWIDQLQAPSGARVLEVGCGAGLLAADLARRGYEVTCIDTSSAMVELAEIATRKSGFSAQVSIEVGDVHALRFKADAFDLVTALGVVPFLHSPQQALDEMARVVRSEGRVLFSSDNKYRLNRVVDPRFVPFPGRESIKAALARAGAKAHSRAPSRLFSYKTVRTMVETSGLEIDRCAVVGFGPFTFLAKAPWSEPNAIKLNNWFQQRTGGTRRGLGRVGAQHLILARLA